MLGRGHRVVRRHAQAIKYSFNAFKRAPWTTGGTLLVVTVTLMLPLLFWLLIGQLKPMMGTLRQGEVISLYLDTSFQMTEQSDLMGKINATKGVKQAVFISADESLAELEKQDGMEDVRRYLSENPLPSMIDVMPTQAVDTPEKLEELFQRLKQYPQIEQAKLNRDWVSRLHGLVRFLTHFTWLLSVLFGLMVVVTIRNLLRLAAEERHDEIQVLKLIGATDGFILRPFLYAGACLGALGALGAFVAVHVILLGFQHALRVFVSPGFGSPFLISFSVYDLLGCLFAGFLLGWVGAYLSLKHQLSHIEPCH